MLDQATRLRALMCRDTFDNERSTRTVLVCGSQPGVGTTTIATNLSLLIGRHRRVVLETADDAFLKVNRRHVGRPEWVLIDGGHVSRKDIQQDWHEADEVLLITTADSIAIMDAYTGIKRNAATAACVPIRVVVNQAVDASRIDDAYARLDRSCRRFLGLGVTLGGSVPLDPCVIAAAQHAAPVIHRYRESSAALAMRAIASLMENAIGASVNQAIA